MLPTGKCQAGWSHQNPVTSFLVINVAVQCCPQQQTLNLTYFNLLGDRGSQGTFVIATNAVCDVYCIKNSLFWTCVFHNINSGCNFDIRHSNKNKHWCQAQMRVRAIRCPQTDWIQMFITYFHSCIVTSFAVVWALGLCGNRVWKLEKTTTSTVTQQVNSVYSFCQCSLRSVTVK